MYDFLMSDFFMDNDYFFSEILCGFEWMLGELSMVNGENSIILLFLKQNANSTSTLSVFSYQFSLLVRKIRVPFIAH
jgi:hypothetical protein